MEPTTYSDLGRVLLPVGPHLPTIIRGRLHEAVAFLQGSTWLSSCLVRNQSLPLLPTVNDSLRVTNSLLYMAHLPEVPLVTADDLSTPAKRETVARRLLALADAIPVEQPLPVLPPGENLMRRHHAADRAALRIEAMRFPDDERGQIRTPLLKAVHAIQRQCLDLPASEAVALVNAALDEARQILVSAFPLTTRPEGEVLEDDILDARRLTSLLDILVSIGESCVDPHTRPATLAGAPAVLPTSLSDAQRTTLVLLAHPDYECLPVHATLDLSNNVDGELPQLIDGGWIKRATHVRTWEGRECHRECHIPGFALTSAGRALVKSWAVAPSSIPLSFATVRDAYGKPASDMLTALEEVGHLADGHLDLFRQILSTP